MVYVSTIISGAASLGVLIGLISGIFFLVLTALRWVARVRASVYEEELRRQKRFLINKSYLINGGTQEFLETTKVENGFGGALHGNEVPEKVNQNFQSNAETPPRWKEKDEDAPTKYDPNPDTIKVRELIEKMVETIIEGPLDGTTVGQLSTHSAYLDMFTKYHNLLCRELARLGFALHLSVVRKQELEVDSTDLKESSLKRLIKQIISEAMALPNIKEILSRPKASKAAVSEDFKNKSYEDILATAILNKVIENFQTKNCKDNDGNDGKPKPRSRMKKIRRDEESAEVKSEDDWSDTSRSDQLSLTIEEYIEEVTTALEGSDDERSELSDFETTGKRRILFPESGRTVVDAGTDDENSDLEEQNTATELITSPNSWEENWLFQKKRLRSTPNAHHPVPVPMLVPNPSEDFRALVGGVDADDLSDMSDYADSILKDFVVEENSFMELPIAKPEEDGLDVREEDIEEENSQKPPLVSEECFDENQEKEISDTKIPNEEEKLLMAEERRNSEEMPQDVADSLESSVLPDVLSQKDRESSIVDFSHQYESLNNPSPSDRITHTSHSKEPEKSSIRFSLAEREREKWLNPAPLAENPYSWENIEKREQKRKKNEYFRIGTYTGESIDFPEDVSSDELSKNESEKFRFSRDYYINASKHPAGKPSLELQPKENVQVSRHSYEAFSSLGRRRLGKLSKPDLYLDIADGSAEYFTPQQQFKTLFPPFQNQTIRRQHFSQVFKTSNILNEDLPKAKSFRKYRYGSHTVKLRPKAKEILSKRSSLGQELSDFEQKSLREDLKHSLLRAKGASPNFILNPVFKSEPGKSPKIESRKQFFAFPHESNEESEEEESELRKSEPIVPSYRRTSGENASRAYNKISRVSQESGYGSDSLEYSSDSLEYWRLTPPKTPEVVESSFVSIVRNRKNKENSRRLRKTFSDLY